MITQFHFLIAGFILCFIFYFGKLIVSGVYEDETALVEEWLDQNDLGEFKKLYREFGISTLSGCGTPEQVDKLPELPAAEEKRLRRAAQVLQQRLILRQWLATHSLQHAYTKLLSLDVSSLEDVYWLEDSKAQHVLDPKDFSTWSLARQSLPTQKEALHLLKGDLWNVVVKTSKHQDAWTWGGMVVVSVSLCGLVTLAAMTQPALAPAARRSLLHYVTGKYLHAPACTVEWGWQEPQIVGDTMCFTVLCFQRNYQPYPICDADDLEVNIVNSTTKIPCVVELGSGDPVRANHVTVKFTVRMAGLYIISVTIGGCGISGSPFRKWFLSGRVCGRRSGVARARDAAVLCAGTRSPLHVLPKDQYDNAALPTEDDVTEKFFVRLAPLGGDEDPTLSSAAEFSYDCVNQRLVMSLLILKPGVYSAQVYYGEELLNNGKFQCIVLNASDLASVTRCVSTKRPWAAFEARLVSARPRRVLVQLSDTHLLVKHYVLSLIPKTMASFRLASATKITLESPIDIQEPHLPEDLDCTPPGGPFTISDGSRTLRLWSSKRNVIAAAAAALRASTPAHDDCFKNKQDYFFSEIRKANSRYPHDKISIRVNRSSLVESSYKATKHFSLSDWCKHIDVTFQGEQGVDWGGVRREWFSLCGAALFAREFGLFAPATPTTDNQALVMPNPGRDPRLKLKYMEFAGKMVGKCIYESALGGSYRQYVRARFARSFLAQLIGLKVTYKHFEQDDPDLYLSKIKYVIETDLDAEDCAVELFFSDDVYDINGRLLFTQDLIPTGATIRVTNDRKLEYLDALAEWRLAARVRCEVEAFLRGLSTLVPKHLLHVFHEPELELVVCGSGVVSAAEWRAHACVGGAGRGWERTVRWFWACVAALDHTERARLLHFATGSTQLPPDGFQELQPRFQLTPAPTFGALPTAHTCFNQLCLPEYPSYEHLVKAIHWAINEGSEGFAMI